MSIKEVDSVSSCNTEEDEDFTVAISKIPQGKRGLLYNGEKISRTLSEDCSSRLGESSHFSDYSSISWSTPMLDKEVPLDVLFSAFIDSHQRQLKYIEKAGWDESTKLKEKVRVLESYVAQLEEQNDVLINTATELERETRKRISLMESRLRKSAKTTKEVVLHLQEYEEHFREMIIEKTQLESVMEDLTQQRSTLKVENGFLRDQNANLRHDLHALLHIMHQARSTGHWELDCVTFCELTPDQVFGPVRSFSRAHSGESFADYAQTFEDSRSHTGTVSEHGSLLTSSCSSLSNLHDDIVHSQKPEHQLRKELRYSQRVREQAQLELLEKDRIIANLETQITTLNYEMTIQKAECDRHLLELEVYGNHQRNENCSINSLPCVCDQSKTVNSNSRVKSLEKIFRPDVQCNGKLNSQDSLIGIHDGDKENATSTSNLVKLSQYKNTPLRTETLDVYTQVQIQDSPPKDVCEAAMQTERKLMDVLTQTEEVKKNIKEIVESSLEKLSRVDFEQLKEQLRRAEDNASAKEVLVIQLQNHLQTSAKEVELKDKALMNVETKLEASRQCNNDLKVKIDKLEQEIMHCKDKMACFADRELNLQQNIEAREDIIKEMKTQEQSLQEQKRVLLIQIDEQAEQIMNLDDDLQLAKNNFDLNQAEVELQKVTIKNLQDALVRSKKAKVEEHASSNVPNMNIARRALSQSSIYDV